MLGLQQNFSFNWDVCRAHIPEATEAARLATTPCPHWLSALSPPSSCVRPCPLCLLPSRRPPCPRADMSSDNWTQFWLVSKVGLPLASWNVPLHFYTPIVLQILPLPPTAIPWPCHPRTALQDTTLQHPTHWPQSLFFQFSPFLPSLGLFS